MQEILKMRWFYLLGFIFLGVNSYLISKDQLLLTAFPIGLLLVYTAIFHMDKLFMFIVFCTPLSVNIEEYVGGSIGLFLPTEPLLFGILILVVLMQFISKWFDREFLRHPITIIFALQFSWIFLTSITSELPLVSFKFLLTKLWFIIPIYFYGYLFFKTEKNIKWFIWLFIGSLTIVVLYTLSNHAMYGFDEETGHWVMFPFFKDHTSYGAILALVFPILIGFLIGRKNGPLVQITLISLIVLFGFAIMMSYTRAAWLSLIAALAVYFLIRFKIRFRYLLAIGMVGLIYAAISWTQIMHSLEKNDAEHATENMDERIESMANITTDASNLERLNRWYCAVRLFEERPILGWGPGTYAMVYAPFQLESFKTIISTNSGNRGNAHSEYLGPMSEQGLPGLILMLVLVGYIFYTAINLYIRMPDGDLRLTVLLLTLALVTYFVHGILNNYLDTDKATVPVWGFTAIIVMLDLKFSKMVKKGDQVKGNQ
ncbi:MAG: O-antigen ligase family protein [Crocinitomicaceae bacterium]|nr:O-antigen ligase family protein [Crocinitomicaceae bacterium]